jgi:uncharacterized protein
MTVLEWPNSHDIDVFIADGWQPTPFREFVLKIHSRCDLSCHYCYMYHMADQSWRSRPKHMSRATIGHISDRIAEHVRAHSLDSVELILHGGEPLLAGPDLIRHTVTTIRSALGPGVAATVGMQTNGVLLDAAYLKLFDELDVHVGVSLDGDADANNRHRRRANGEGSHAAVVRGLEQLTSEPFRHLFSGLLCTIDPRNAPVSTYEALLRFEPPAVDFLLPHGNWSTPPPGRVTGSGETPYGDWLAAVFDRWYRVPREETRVRLFREIMNLLMGKPSATEEIGLSPVGVVVIETDGSIEQADSLKSAYHGAPATGLHVDSDSFDAALRLPSVAARQIGERALSPTCRSCRIRQVCGGGLYAHRYRADNGFANPSVYCPDLLRIIDHIRGAMESDVAFLRKVQ